MAGFSHRITIWTLRWVLIVAVTSTVSCGSWRSKPPERWSANDVGQILHLSPWVSLETVRVLSPVKEVYGGQPMGRIDAGAQMIRFCWLSDPILQAFSQSESGQAKSVGSGYMAQHLQRLPGLDGFRFFQTLRTLVANYGAEFFKERVYVVVESQLLVDLNEQVGGPVMENAFAESPKGVLPAEAVLYGIEYRVRSLTRRGDIPGATVDLKTLKKGQKGRGIPIDLAPIGKRTFEVVDDYAQYQELHSIVLVFPRTVGGDPVFTPDLDWVDIVIPLRRGSLRTRFHLKAMSYRGTPSY